MAPKPRPPDLDQCIQTLQRLSKDILSKPPKQIGEVFVASIGLLCHLKADQATLHKAWSTKNDGEGTIVNCPPPQAIPAITAVITNTNLFFALVACLKSSVGDHETEVISSNRPQQGRKRTFSFADNHDGPPAKSLKVAQSPSVSKRVMSQGGKPQFNVKGLAATILYTAFAHVDHWPYPLVQAYADDCFGARSWVDQPECKLLVDNLAMSHALDVFDKTEVDKERDAQALLVAEYYHNQENNQNSSSKSNNTIIHDNKHEPQSPLRAKKRGSFSSISSQLSSSAVNSMPAPSALPSSRASSVTSASTGPHSAPNVISATSGVSNTDNGDSSSSGEEEDEEEVVVTNESFDEGGTSRSVISSLDTKVSSAPPSAVIAITAPTYPVVQRNLNLIRVRQRYFGLNLEYAHNAVSTSLAERLDVKSKQNSGLLQCLPSFTSIPTVRRQITANLERWLQSPALSGLARSLFSRTVKMMRNVDPPLPADLEAVNNILGMRLKANQLNAHIENITAIATKIPTASIAHQIYIRLLQEVILTLDITDSSGSDFLKMIGAVHHALPDRLSAEGMATSLLTLLMDHEKYLSQIDRNHLVKKLRAVIRAVASSLGSSFDGCLILEYLLSSEIRPKSWSLAIEEDKARLMFQCATLSVSTPSNNLDHTARNQPKPTTRKGPPSEAEIPSLKKKLLHSRKLLLNWCCNYYAPECIPDQPYTKNNHNGRKHDRVNDENIGAGIPDYSSILDGINTKNFPSWLMLIRSLLFMETGESDAIKSFLFCDVGQNVVWTEEVARIGLCVEHGADVDNDMVWIILNSTGKKRGIPAEAALSLLEHLFYCCSKNKKATLNVTDPDIMWELYSLVEYFPSKSLLHKKKNGKQSKGGDGVFDDAEEETEDMDVDKNDEDNDGEEEPISKLPQLAYPGFWWRVTCLALVMCGASPATIGTVAWESHPTLRSMIKMVTSSRYRFPTVDCDDKAREEMKRMEQSMRDEEGRITELLFLPAKPRKPKQEDEVAPESMYGGSRASKRQKEKREKALKKQREKEAAEYQAEANRRKKMLKAAQKSIMILDPRKGPRKPPRESADLIFSVGELFGLPEIFQRSIKPDFVLTTIGETSRGAIERAYDWLIPIISFLPDTIDRLPSSASCFLLLRAYGTEGDERAQLQELSAPLLRHVSDSLKGSFGQADAIRAFDLLLTDVASHNLDRRRCARRVLYDAIGKGDYPVDEHFENSQNSWMVNILHLEHADHLVNDAIKYMSKAANFERGKTFRSLVLALERHIDFAKEKGISDSWNFPSMLIALISSRPSVCAGAMDAYPELRTIVIRVVYNELDAYIHDKSKEQNSSVVDSAVVISIYQPDGQNDGAAAAAVQVTLPFSLLQSACVLLSIWQDDSTENDTDNLKGGSNSVHRMVDMLMRPKETPSSVVGDEDGNEGESTDGLASAIIGRTGKSAVPVESWVMLARSRSDVIARRAALTAPTGFLPRLLLCSGLPRSSLLTMIDRLGRMGEKASDTMKTFNQLLVPSASSEWDIGRLGHRREIARKLLGRLSAYSRMHNFSAIKDEEEISFTFLEWLSETCRTIDKPSKRSKGKKSKALAAVDVADITFASAAVSNIASELAETPNRHRMQIEGDASDMTIFRPFGTKDMIPKPTATDDMDVISKYIEQLFDKNDPTILEEWLSNTFENVKISSGPSLSKKSRNEDEDNLKLDMEIGVSISLLQCHSTKRPGLMSRPVLKWVPVLTRSHGSPDLWKLVFLEDCTSPMIWKSLLSRCLECWNRSHITSCTHWLLQEDNTESVSATLVIRFLVNTSGRHSVHVERFSKKSSPQLGDTWATSQEFVASASSLVLRALDDCDNEATLTEICSRNHPPDWLRLLLLLGDRGRTQVQFLSQAIVKRIDQSEVETRKILLAVILRLYAYFPASMNLGVAVLRTVLMEAVGEYADEWLVWRSPLDDQFGDMLLSVISNGTPPRLIQALMEGAKRHPLLMLRKLGFMEHVLTDDAMYTKSAAPNDGSVFDVKLMGDNLDGPVVAKLTDGKLVKVTVKHWGFCFTENLWIAFLEIVTAVPKEVLFTCGLKLGLLDFVGVYLRLFFIQSQLTSGGRLSRLKGKLSEFFSAFEATNKEGWEKWLLMKSSGLDSLGPTRNILMSCNFITPQAAMDRVKK